MIRMFRSHASHSRQVRVCRQSFDERQMARGPRHRAGRRSRRKLKALGLIV